MLDSSLNPLYWVMRHGQQLVDMFQPYPRNVSHAPMQHPATQRWS